MIDLLKTQKDRLIMYANNQNAIRLVKNPEFHKQTKHIDVHHHIREKFSEGMFALKYVSNME